MIEISFGKLVLLALVALIVLGPEKLPGAARTAGALIRRVRQSWDGVRAEVERELEIEEIRRAAHANMLRMEAAQRELDATIAKVEAMQRTPVETVLEPRPAEPELGAPATPAAEPAETLPKPEEPDGRA